MQEILHFPTPVQEILQEPETRMVDTFLGPLSGYFARNLAGFPLNASKIARYWIAPIFA